MIVRPSIEDIKNVGYDLGRIILGVSLCMCLPIVVGLLSQEINPALDFIMSQIN